MKKFITIRDNDIDLDIETPDTYQERVAARAIVFDVNNNIALLHATKKNYHKLPGGGVEKDEEIIAALKREALKEIGCDITDIRELGTIEEYRNKHSLHQISYCFIAELNGVKGPTQLEEGEIADGFEPVWLSLDEAIQTLENEFPVKDYQGKFIQMRDLTFLKETKAAQSL